MNKVSKIIISILMCFAISTMTILSCLNVKSYAWNETFDGTIIDFITGDGDWDSFCDAVGKTNESTSENNNKHRVCKY